MTQNALPGFDSAATWLRSWLARHQAELGDVQQREELYEAAWQDLPGVLWPSLADTLKRYWFRPMWRQVLKQTGWTFLGGAEGEQLARFRGTTVDQAREHVLMLLRGASADIAAAQRYLEDFAEAWPEIDIDVEATMAELRAVAGL